jgi:hypothetical protein
MRVVAFDSKEFLWNKRDADGKPEVKFYSPWSGRKHWHCPPRNPKFTKLGMTGELP